MYEIKAFENSEITEEELDRNLEFSKYFTDTDYSSGDDEAIQSIINNLECKFNIWSDR